VGTCAAYDARGIEPMASPQRLAQLIGAPVGIPVDLAGQSAVGGHGFGARPKGAFVRGETDRPLDAGNLCLAADIGDDSEDARPGRRTRYDRHSLNLSPGPVVHPARPAPDFASAATDSGIA